MNENNVIRIPAMIVVLLVIVSLTTIGLIVSPRNEQGHPLLLMADVKAVEDYRRLADQTAKDLRLVDGEISTTLAGDTTDLFGQTRNAQNAFEHILNVSQVIDQHEAPPALVGLRDELNQVSLAYLDAGRLTLQWLSVPDQKNSDLAQQKLSEARKSLDDLENSQWLQMKSP